MCMSPASPLADAIMPACICFQSRFVVLAPASFSKSAGISAMAIAAAKAGCVPADSQHACCNVKRLGSAVSGPATATSTGTDWWLQPLLKHLEGLATSLHTDLRAIFDEGVDRYGSDALERVLLDHPKRIMVLLGSIARLVDRKRQRDENGCIELDDFDGAQPQPKRRISLHADCAPPRQTKTRRFGDQEAATEELSLIHI